MKELKVRVKFSPESADMPLAWYLATKFGIRFSILQAELRAGQGGRMIMDLSGEPEDLNNALAFARDEGIDVKVLHRSVSWDNDVCVHCGACTAVCTRKALTLDPVTAELAFNNARCVACEMCTRACPTGAMHVDELE